MLKPIRQKCSWPKCGLFLLALFSVCILCGCWSIESDKPFYSEEQIVPFRNVVLGTHMSVSRDGPEACVLVLDSTDQGRAIMRVWAMNAPHEDGWRDKTLGEWTWLCTLFEVEGVLFLDIEDGEGTHRLLHFEYTSDDSFSVFAITEDDISNISKGCIDWKTIEIEAMSEKEWRHARESVLEWIASNIDSIQELKESAESSVEKAMPLSSRIGAAPEEEVVWSNLIRYCEMAAPFGIFLSILLCLMAYRVGCGRRRIIYSLALPLLIVVLAGVLFVVAMKVTPPSTLLQYEPYPFRDKMLAYISERIVDKSRMTEIEEKLPASKLRPWVVGYSIFVNILMFGVTVYSGRKLRQSSLSDSEQKTTTARSPDSESTVVKDYDPPREHVEPVIIGGAYILKEVIGRGGMGKVFIAEVDLNRFDYTLLYAYSQVQGETHYERLQKAEQFAKDLAAKSLDLATVRKILDAHGIPLPAQTVALKMDIGRGCEDRFQREWKNLICLNHPNVISVYGGGIHEHSHWYSMELIPGILGAEEIHRDLSLAEKLKIIVDAAKGLSYLHSKGIIHRDVKPDNLITLRHDDGRCRTKVTDLGLAKNIEEENIRITCYGPMGTPRYMPIEQWVDTHTVDERADIYSLGATLYQFTAGVPPYHDKTTIPEIQQALARGEQPKPIRCHAPWLPRPLAEIIETAMAYQKEDRYESMGLFMESLEKFIRSCRQRLDSMKTFRELGS